MILLFKDIPQLLKLFVSFTKRKHNIEIDKLTKMSDFELLGILINFYECEYRLMINVTPTIFIVSKINRDNKPHHTIAEYDNRISTSLIKMYKLAFTAANTHIMKPF